MQIIPAMDLKNGQIVRLKQGHMQQATQYDLNPLKLASQLQDIGAKYLHIIDLDGAIQGSPQNKKTIEQIAAKSSLQIQVGGGIRDEKTIQEYLNLGVSRVILGSIATKDPHFVIKMAQQYPIILGIDAKNQKVATQGWVKTENIDALDFAKSFCDAKLQAIICTDIQRDGMLQGINLAFTKAICQASKHNTIASGGFSSINELYSLQEAGIQGLIIGKAFYEGTINLKEIYQKFPSSPIE